VVAITTTTVAKAIAPKIMEPRMSICESKSKGSTKEINVGGSVMVSGLELNRASGDDFTLLQEQD